MSIDVDAPAKNAYALPEFLPPENENMNEMPWYRGLLHRRWQELLLPVGILGCLFIIFVPLPAPIMDVLLSANIAIAVVVLLTAVFVRTPLEFSVFPSLLLLATLARLSLNIATTRLILSSGASQETAAAGQLIQSFGEFVAGDHLAIGLVIFLIIVIVQFVVITRGATRISEVTARFALDGMPGRQMSIDADLNAGVISNVQAKRQRSELSAHAEFYGAMDGASKFVRGDAVAGILITLINIVGGLIVGLTSNLSLLESASIFTKLTIGDGLASQVPALFTSVAAAMLITRPASESNLPVESVEQLSTRPIALVITGCFLLAMMFTSLPTIPLLILSIACFAAARFASTRPETDETTEDTSAASKAPAELTIEKLLGNEILEMELGLDLIPLADPKLGGKLLPAVTDIRKKLASDLGVILPKIRIRDNLQLPQTEYRILVQGNPVDIGTIFPKLVLAVDGGHASGPLPDAVATETTSSGQAYWIEPSNRDAAARLGYNVASATSVLTSRTAEVANQYASHLLTRDATNQLIEETRKTSPAIIEEVLPNLISLKDLQKLLKQLVSEQVSIRPLGLILETIGDEFAQGTTDHWTLVEKVRERLAPQITARHLQGGHAIKAITVDDEFQNEMLNKMKWHNGKLESSFRPSVIAAFLKSLRQGSDSMKTSQLTPRICVRQEIRPMISSLASDHEIDVIVLGSREIVGTYVESIGEISIDAIQSNDSVAA